MARANPPYDYCCAADDKQGTKPEEERGKGVWEGKKDAGGKREERRRGGGGGICYV